MNPPGSRPFPLLGLVCAAAGTVGAVAYCASSPRVDFGPYFGRISPIGAAAGVCLVGIMALYVLQERFGFYVVRPGGYARARVFAGVWVFPFIASITLIDAMLPFPVGMNVPLPTALVFYPAMGFIAELALHVVPLTLLLGIGVSVVPRASFDQRLWACILCVSLLEAGFQVVAALGPGAGLRAALVALHVFAFGVVELHLLRSLDLVCMYQFRIAYYSYWHIAKDYLAL